jgi:hypothetical protein
MSLASCHNLNRRESLEGEMPERFRTKKPHNALKHGAYSTMGLLPGESPAEFEKLRKSLFDELAPQGPLEEDTVSTIARLLWRKQNLATFQAAEWARRRCGQIIDEEKARRKIPTEDRLFLMLENPVEESEEMRAAREEAVQAGQEKARHELGEYYELAWGGYHTDTLTKDLEVEALLEAAIDKCMKRLLMVRGAKSMSVVAPSPPAQLSKPRSLSRTGT